MRIWKTILITQSIEENHKVNNNCKNAVSSESL